MFRKKIIVIITLSIILAITNMITLGAQSIPEDTTYASPVSYKPITCYSTLSSQRPSFNPMNLKMNSVKHSSSIDFAYHNTVSTKSFNKEKDDPVVEINPVEEDTVSQDVVPEVITQVEEPDVTEEVIPESQTVHGYNYSTAYDVTWTAYCLCKNCCGKSPEDPGFGITASGYKITQGIGEKVIAVDPDIIPLGSYVYVEILDEGVEDYGYALAADTGGAINNYHIDLYIDGHYGPWYGKGNARVYIISTP